MFSLILLLVIPAVTFILLVLLYVCVLAHELAHSANALRNNVKVKRIVLSLLGGASVIDDINIDPRVEFNITMVGPIISIFLGALFGVIEVYTGPGLLSYMLNWLFLWNMFLGIFNLIPIFPLDGGRIMRSWLQRRKDFYSATMQTARISKYLIGVFIVVMIAYILVDNESILYNEFLAFVTFFTIFYIYGGLRAEESSATIRKATKGVRISSLVSKEFTIIAQDTSIDKLYLHMLKGKGRVFLIKQKDGMYIVNLTSKPPSNVKYAKDISFKIPTVDSKTEVSDVLARMESDESGAVAVAQNRKFVGIVTMSQIQSFIFLHMMKGKTARKV